MSVAIVTCSAAVRKGDINGDGRVTAADAREILRVAAKVDEF